MEGALAKLVVSRTRDVVIVMDAAGMIRAFHPGAERALGWRKSDVVGRSLRDLLPPDRESSGRVIEVLQRCFSEDGEIESEIDLLGSGGDAHRLELRATPVAGEDGEKLLVIIATDVSERAQISERLSDAVRLEQLPWIAAGIGHDLNNLLTIIDASLERAARLSDPSGEEARAMTDARLASARSIALCRGLFALSRGASGTRSRGSIASLITETAELTVAGRRATLRCEVEDGLWPVEVDASQISQVIQNLVVNAVEAISDRGQIEVVAENQEAAPDVPNRFRSGRHVVVRVRDQGPGIAQAVRERLFQPFVTTKGRGSGLGLTTTHYIVRAHEGFVRLESEPGRGTTFEVWLPACE